VLDEHADPIAQADHQRIGQCASGDVVVEAILQYKTLIFIKIKTNKNA
jgi:hypothetical protein